MNWKRLGYVSAGSLAAGALVTLLYVKGCDSKSPAEKQAEQHLTSCREEKGSSLQYIDCIFRDDAALVAHVNQFLHAAGGELPVRQRANGDGSTETRIDVLCRTAAENLYGAMHSVMLNRDGVTPENDAYTSRQKRFVEAFWRLGYCDNVDPDGDVLLVEQRAVPNK